MLINSLNVFSLYCLIFWDSKSQEIWILFLLYNLTVNKPLIKMYFCVLWVLYNWKDLISKDAFTVIFIPLFTGNDMCLFTWAYSRVLWDTETLLLSFQSLPALTFPCRRWVSSCRRLFLRSWSPPFTISNCSTLSGEECVEESDPKYSPGCWLGGWADCRPQQGPKGVICTTLSSHNTDRGTGEDP